MSAPNYATAVEILQTRFGKPQNIIIAHTDNLLKLPVCTNDKPHQLRLIYDKAYAHMCGLESLGIGASQCGSFLIPVIMSKLPHDVRLQIARISVKDVWEVEELMTAIKKEVRAGELCDTIKITESHLATQPRKPFLHTASALEVMEGGGGKIICVYCKGSIILQPVRL